MSNNISNYPQARLTREIEKSGEFVHDTVSSISCISELAINGKPKDEAELRDRISRFFDFCSKNQFRPGIEALSLALGVNRTTFWHWCNSEYGVSDEWADICKLARQSIIAFVEASANSGHLSPPIAIFSLKNLANWKDTLSFEDLTPEPEKEKRVGFNNLSSYRLSPTEESEDNS